MSDPHESDQRPSDLPSNGKTILLAEDDPFISRMYQAKLTNAGYEVALVHNGNDAYNFIKKDSPDMVVLDISMPDLSGFEVIQALQDDGLDGILKRVMVLTNSSDPRNQAKARELDIDYIVKAEVTPQEVLARINQKLGLS